MTGRGPSPLADRAHECITIDADSTAAVQENHLIALHALCAALDAALVHESGGNNCSRGSVSASAVTAQRVAGPVHE